jgi:FkbM family methyltransferase
LAGQAIIVKQPNTPWWLFRLRRFFRVASLPLDGLRLVGYGSGLPKGLAHQIACGTYEAAERAAIKAIIRPGDRVVDIGACVGVVTLLAARIAGAENVFAYEPNVAAAAIARRNFAANGLAVSLETVAVGAFAGTAELHAGDGGWLGARVSRHLNGKLPPVGIKPIAEIIAERRPTVLILDAEGMEAEILPACPMDGLRALIVEFHDIGPLPERVKALRSLLAERGFRRDDALSTISGDVSTEAWLR